MVSRQEGFEEVRSNPVLDIYMRTALTAHFKWPTVGKWSTSTLAAIENHRCPSKSGCSYAALFIEDQRRTRARTLFMPQR